MAANTFILMTITLEKERVYIGINMYALRVLASFGGAWLWVQMFFWLRLFDKTARYVDLIIETVVDIGIFTLILLLLLILFATGVYMVQLNRMHYAVDESEYLFEYDPADGLNMLVESVLYQYKVLLGDFGEGKIRRTYQDVESDWALIMQTENVLVLFYFLGMTFFTQITILNMLIAIMSDTFSRQTSNLNQLGKSQKLNMMAEYLKIVNFYRDKLFKICRSKSSEHKSRYLFVVFPVENEDEDDDEIDETT